MNHEGIRFLTDLLKYECGCLLNLLAMSHGVSQRNHDVAVAGDINLKGFFRKWKEDFLAAASLAASSKSSLHVRKKPFRLMSPATATSKLRWETPWLMASMLSRHEHSHFRSVERKLMPSWFIGSQKTLEK